MKRIKKLYKKIKKRIKKKLLTIAKNNLYVRDLIRFMLDKYRLIRYKSNTLFTKVDEKTIFFCVFQGKNYSCSPKAIYEYMQQDERFSDYTFVWAFKKKSRFKKFFVNSKNTILVNYGGKEYRKYLAKSKYWIINYKVEDFLKPKKNQVFVQCWHGTPLKKLGFDLEHFDNVLNTVEGMQHRYAIEAKKIDYFLSPSKYTTEKIISAWGFDRIGREDVIIEEGYPRNDFLSNYTEEDVERMKLYVFGEDYPKDKKVILYAPTYRSNQHESGKGYVYDLPVDFDYLQEKLGDEYVILFRTHYFIASKYDLSKYKGFVYNVSAYKDINKLYIISDMLITDYSSVFFDFANLKRPMLFYMYDLEHYRDESNGFYFDVETELPGPIVKTEEEMVNAIIELGNNFVFDEKYQAFNDKYNYLDDGNASKRVVEKLFNLN